MELRNLYPDSPQQSFYVENLGCAKNQVDAEVIIAALEREGWKSAEGPSEATLIIVNTCSFIEPARVESVNSTLELRSRFPGKRIIIAGCMSQQYGERLLGMLPEVDGVFGNRSPGNLPEMLEGVFAGKRPVHRPESGKISSLYGSSLSTTGSAYVKIAEGCDNRCSFCSIPLIRGNLRSLPIGTIVDEIKSLLDDGAREICLIAQDLAAYGTDRGAGELAELLGAILSLKGKFWLRMLYMHPDHFPKEVLQICRSDPRLLPYFDLPFQHGSSRVLSAMGRSGNADVYVDLVDEIREILPGAVIRSSFLVGFPNERREDYIQLLRFQQRARLDWLGVFVYSREQDTLAYSMGLFPRLRHRLLLTTVSGRKNRIEELQIPITEERLQKLVGDIQEVFIEERIEQTDLYLGRSYMHAPEVDGQIVVHGTDLPSGTIIEARITGVNGFDLEADAI